MKISEFMQYAAGVMVLLVPLLFRAEMGPMIVVYYWSIFIGAAVWSAIMWRGNR